MTLDIDLMLRVATLAMSAGAMVAAWIATRRKDVDERFAEHRARIEGVEKLAERLTQRVQVLPGREDVHQLDLALTRIEGEMKTMTALMTGQKDIMSRLEAIVTRHEEHLLGESRR